jgi:predicted nuclease of restriction endonuclease-like (RecB) superfamily
MTIPDKNIVSLPLSEFAEIAALIKKSKYAALQAVNSELINLYWQIGEYIAKRIESEGWGKSVVVQLADFIQNTEPTLKGFSSQNLWRMRQFYETYKDAPKLAALWREISWTNNLIILNRCKTEEEKEFYLRLSSSEKLTSRELERQIDTSVFERTMLGKQKLSAVLREIHPNIENAIRDKYVFEFLDLPEDYSESDLQKSLVVNFRKFILEIGKDFAYLGEGFRLQVGSEDFYLDLLFYHRGLQCLVNFELKIKKFKPEFLGKLNFYLEALDRDVKKEHENPSIGVLLCQGKDEAVVEYALARNLSPAVIADYETKLPDKKLLRAKLEEFSQFLESGEASW